VRRQRLDDIDGSQAAKTVAFALDGRHYEIDLSEANAAALREVFAPYVAVSRRAVSRRGAAGTSAGLAAADKPRRAHLGKASSPVLPNSDVKASTDHAAAPSSTGELTGQRPRALREAESSTITAATAGAPLAAVVSLPQRRRAQLDRSDIIERRRQLAADVSELTRVVTVAIVAAAADRLVALIIRPGRTDNAKNRARSDKTDVTRTINASNASSSSIAPTG